MRCPPAHRNSQSLTGQLYTSWDKVLVDLRDRKSGGVRDYEEEVRTVKTKFPDAAGKDGVTTSDEAWVEIPRATYQVCENNIGMSIAHKPVGKYDTEVDEVAEPAGFAYMAPVGERNQYGYWDHGSGGNFWVFYGQYALLRDLLWGHSYRPIPSYEWESYRTARSSGQTYYGRDEAAGAPKYGTHGTFTQQHYADSRYVRSAGGYSNSKYATGGLSRGESSEGHTFGSASKPPSSGIQTQKFARLPAQLPAAFRRPLVRAAAIGCMPGRKSNVTFETVRDIALALPGVVESTMLVSQRSRSVENFWRVFLRIARPNLARSWCAWVSTSARRC